MKKRYFMLVTMLLLLLYQTPVMATTPIHDYEYILKHYAHLDGDELQIALLLHEAENDDIIYIPSEWNSQFKSYMPYTAVTMTNSPQYKILNATDKAHTDENGLRMYEDRYCIAVGSSICNYEIGKKLTVILKNGTIIPCIVADMKANCDTLANNIQATDGSVLEFIVDYSIFNNTKDSSGTVNFVTIDGKSFDDKVDIIVLEN